ncbi:MAG: pyridoxal-phosphate dependent enzyme, partial [Planctomycetota bacterium]
MITGKHQQQDVRQWVLDAEERSREYLWETPLEYSLHLSKLTSAEVYLKLDSMQKTGSFKFRGAVSKIMSLTEEELNKGVVSASTGNFALALGEAARLRSCEVTIYVAKNIEASRLELIKAHGVDVVVYGEEALDAEKRAREVAEQEGKIYVSPYNDPVVVGGQGTCGLEISKQLSDVQAAFFAVGGGGLCSGSGGWLKSFNPDIEIIGVSPERSPVMYESVKANKIIEMETFPTLADTCAGGVDPDTITLKLCQKYVDEIILLTERQIEDSIRLLFEHHRLIVEGSGALSVGGL